MQWTDIAYMLGGLGLFLYGMDLMGVSLRATAGNKLKTILEKLTSNQVLAVLVGTLVTMVIQSSSATSVIVIGFVNAGLMNLKQAFGVMLGANIGTTITAQIIALKVTDIAPIVLVIGAAMFLFIKNRRARNIGGILAGFGILFVGLNMMSDALEPLKTTPWFIEMMAGFSNPILGVLVGVAVTVIIQSSSASVGILQALAMQGLVAPEISLYIVLGCNIGTCITAVLASLGTNAMGKRTAIIHLLNKIIGTIVFLVLMAILPIAEWIMSVSPGDTTQQIANFHTIFNIVNTIILLPFCGACVKLAMRIVKDPDGDQGEMRLMYLDERTLETPAIAMVELKQEITRMGHIVQKNYQLAVEAFLGNDTEKAAIVSSNEQLINYLSTEISRFIVKFQTRTGLSARDKRDSFNMHSIIIDLERIGDHAENVAEYINEMNAQGAVISDDAMEELKDLIAKVSETLEAGLRVMYSEYTDKEAQDLCANCEDEVDALHEKCRRNHITRLSLGQCDPLGGMIFTDIGIDLERIADHATNLAGVQGELANPQPLQF